MARTIVRLVYLGLAAPLLAGGAMAWAQDARPPANRQEAELIAVLKSSAPQKDKADACLELSRIGTKESVQPLAALLSDEKMAHMARYALEPIPDPAVDAVLREALGRLKGRPLVGVIGSIGVRRDAKAVEPLTALLNDKDAAVAQAAARALGSLGTTNAVKALEDALVDAPAANQLAIAEGLFRCAENLLARDRRGETLAIYDRLSQPKMPQSVRDGALRKARFLRQQPGPTL
jgi:HEAT repeat protein